MLRRKALPGVSLMAQFWRAETTGGVVEWLMAPVLKTGRAQALVGSNPTPSARLATWNRVKEIAAKGLSVLMEDLVK